MAKELQNFRQYLQQLLKSDIEDENFIKDVRTAVAILDPTAKKAYFLIALKLSKKHRRFGPVVALYKLMARNSVSTNQSNDLPAILTDALRWCRTRCAGKEANAILTMVKTNARNLTGSADSLLPIIAEETRTLIQFNKFSTAINRLIAASEYFSRFGAFQSAYRALGKAETIARTNNLIRELADVVFALALVASDEGDKSFAAEHFALAIQLREQRGLAVPASHRLNHASMLMQLGKYGDAEKVFESIMDNPDDERMKLALRTNLAVCKRHTTSLQASADEIRKAQPLLKHSKYPEELAEYHLVAAKTYLLAKKPNNASRHIAGALEAIHELISAAARLHYRRGVRNSYVNRIRSMIRPCVDMGMRRSLLACLAFVSASTTADWCRYLEWCEASLEDKLVPERLKQSLRDALQDVTRLGAPVLSGFREKYDDPFENVTAFDYNAPWTIFEKTLKEVALRREKGTPYRSDPESDGYLKAKLAEGVMLMFAVSTAAGCEVVALHRDSVWNYTLPEPCLREYFRAFNEYVATELPRNEFIPILGRTSATMANGLTTILNQVVSRGVKQVLVIADGLSITLPWIAPFVEKTEIRRSMRSGECTVASCAFPFPAARSAQTRPENVQVIYNSAELLPLAADELRMVGSFLNPQVITNVDLGKDEEPLTSLDQIDLIHYAGHGFPVSRYSEPSAAGITENQFSLNLSDVQTICANGHHSLVFLNACHSASSANRNHFQSFRTSENIGFPSMFMLNRKSQVVAPIWAVPDLAAFAFSVFFYRRLSEGASAAHAYNFAVAEFYDATNARVVSVLGEISDEAVRRSKVRYIEQDPTNHPLRRVYCYGSYRLHCLL